MKSIKPGRGPSKLSAIGNICVAAFGVCWCVVVGIMGAWYMIPFGLIIVGLSIYYAWYHYRNATSENRNSVVDIVDSDEEPDPLNEKYGRKKNDDEIISDSGTSEISVGYCPYCGKPVETGFAFCPKCGKRL